MTRTLKIILLLVAAASLGACNTIAGLGQDLQNLGRTIDKGVSSKDNSKSEPSSSGVVVTPIK